MARLKLELPARFAFTTLIAVRVTDLNYGRHLGNDAVLGLVHEARFRFLRAHGLSELDFEGCGLILADAAIRYRAEAFAGDELRCEVAVGDLTRAGCDFFYRLTRVGDERLVAEAKTGVVFLARDTGKIVPLPPAVHRLAAL
jgi:acyl-CoA thioesterase FadM